jgi:hypothetical protein
MITWRKLMKSGQIFLPNMIFIAAIRCCATGPQLNGLSPLSADQGTDVRVTLTGDHFDASPCNPNNQPPQLFVDGHLNGGSDGVTVTGVTPIDDTQIQVDLHIDPVARTGFHSIVVETIAGASDDETFAITCPGCPFPPRLWVVFNNGSSPLILGGPPVTFKIIGNGFLNNNPQLHIDGAGIYFPAGPYNVQRRSDGGDEFLVPITANANATPGDHDVWVTTAGGTSDINGQGGPLTVTAPQPPTGQGLSYIDTGDPLNPQHINTYPAAPVLVKLGGTGFGGTRNVEVWHDSHLLSIPPVFPTYRADPDKVIVAYLDPQWLLFEWATLQVHNYDNNTTSNPLYLSLDELDYSHGGPIVYGCDLQVEEGGDADGVITGVNLRDVTADKFHGIPGLTFSNVRPDPFGQTVFFHVHAAPDTPVTGDEVTNLYVYSTPYTPSSNMFAVTVLQPPPFPPPVLDSITPAHITRPPASGPEVSFKFEGTGFGATRAIYVDLNDSLQHFGALGTNQANPDEVVVGLAYGWVAGSDTSVTLHVRNLDNGTVSNGVPVVLDDPAPGAPVVTQAYLAINQNGDNDFLILGANLQDVNEQSFSGVTGLTFSNIQPDPNFPPGQALRVHAHADASTPLSGDEATNLIITDGNGRQSNPFWIEIVPP